jgi:hypothetical protein
VGILKARPAGAIPALLAGWVALVPLAAWPWDGTEVPVSEGELGRQTGGFVLDNGMAVDLSWSRSVSINGVEHQSTRFRWSGDATPGRLPRLTIETGPGPFGAAGVADRDSLIIRNTLDNQVIATFTRIDVGLSKLNNNRLFEAMPIAPAWNGILLR